MEGWHHRCHRRTPGLVSRFPILPAPTHGGGDRTRTCDPLLAKQELYQLSYAPGKWWAYVDSNHRPYAYQAYALTT